MILQILPSSALSTDLPIYLDNLASGWQNWSWNNTTVNFANSNPVYRGSASIAVTFTQGWAGFQLGHQPAQALSGANTLRFWIHGGAGGGQKLSVRASNEDFGAPPLEVIPKAGVWTPVDVPLDELVPAAVYSVQWFNNTAGAQATFYLDDISFVTQNRPPKPTQPGPALSVNAHAPRHPISPYIYGINFADEALAAELRLPVRRWGGNSTTRYNWQNDTHNTGSDWYFENIPNPNPNPSILPNDSTTDRFVEQDRRTATQTLLTVPLIGWTPKRRTQGHPYDCGFSITRYGPQESRDPWDSDCGNGTRPDGAKITGNDPSDTSAAITPGFVTAWINHLKGRYGTAAAGGVLFYNLDNEPMLWNDTHRDVHPAPTSYDEMRDRTYAYAAAIKAADPGAKTLGPTVWGWCAYFYSAVDGCSIGADYRNHGNLPFIPWYLQQMRTYEQQQGVRILDYLDVHYYPQAQGVYNLEIGDSNTQARRLRSTRSLWDPGYTDESWISTPVNLIPRMRQWINTYYPGTQLAITEYSWGALRYLNGALAQADVLGIFGREGVNLATLWDPPTAAQPGAMAFRMYRNYDGAGGAFGNISVGATSGNPDQLAIYSALSGSNLTLMLINKTDTPLISSVALNGFNPTATARVYRYGPADRTRIIREPDQSISPTGFTATFPASSITLVVAPVENAPTGYPLTVTKIGKGSGTVTSSPAGITCGSDCTESYPTNTLVKLTATPLNAGSVFVGWSGACTGTATVCTVKMDAAKTATANFKRVAALTVAPSGSGAGRVNGPGINCGLDCAETYDLNTVVTLTATAYSGSTHIGWFNCPASPTPNQCRVTMNAARTVAARFNTTTAGKTALTLYKAGMGLGTVTSNPAGITCGPTCSTSVFNFTTGAPVVLTAVETPGSTFTGWTGCTVNPANRRQCTVVLNTGKVVSATFARPVLTVRKVGSGLVATAGTSGIFCGTDCTEPYNFNAQTTLVAIPATGYRFTGWSGCMADPGFPQLCTVPMNQSKTVTAHFIR